MQDIYIYISIHKKYIYIHTYLPIRKHIILQGYDNYMSYFMSYVNPYDYLCYEAHLNAKKRKKTKSKV